MAKAAQSTARLIDQRSRRRATQALIENHRVEFDKLFFAYRDMATAEAERLNAASTSESPPRLKPGRRKEGESTLDRIDVARCPLCIRSHDTGHTCPGCGRKPSPAPNREIEALRLYVNGVDPREIAVHLGIPVDRIHTLIRAANQ